MHTVRLGHTVTRFALALLLGGAMLHAGAADLLATVKARGTLKVALEGTYPPFNFKDGGTLAGYDVDVARLLAQRMGLKAEFISSEWASILAGLSAGRYDVIVSQVGINAKRELAFDFSDPYIYSQPQLIVRKDEKASFTSLADLNQVLGEEVHKRVRESWIAGSVRL